MLKHYTSIWRISWIPWWIDLVHAVMWKCYLSHSCLWSLTLKKLELLEKQETDFIARGETAFLVIFIVSVFYCYLTRASEWLSSLLLGGFPWWLAWSSLALCSCCEASNEVKLTRDNIWQSRPTQHSSWSHTDTIKENRPKQALDFSLIVSLIQTIVV